MYEVKNTTPRSSGTARTATEQEVIAAVNGKLQPREQKGDRGQIDLARLGTNGMPVGRPLGATTGLPVFMAICYILQQNEKSIRARRFTDQEIAEWLRKEFPGRKTGSWNCVTEMRYKYNHGKYTRGIAPKVPSHRYDSGGQEIDPVYRRRK